MGEMVDRVKAVIKLNIENAQIGKDGRVFDKYELAAKAAIEAMPKTTESEAYWIAYAALSAVDAHRDLNGMRQATKAVMAQIEAFEAKRRL